MLKGLSYQKGIDNFDTIMPKDRINKLHQACLETKGFKWCEHNFIQWIICVAGRESHCSKECRYRLKIKLPLQTNAIRIEIMFPSDRCGKKVKSNCIGGHPLDYEICTYNENDEFPQPKPFR